MPSTTKTIVEKGKAGYPAIYLFSPEDQRSLREAKAAAKELDRKFYIWTFGKGLVEDTKKDSKPIQDTEMPPGLLNVLSTLPEKSVIALRLFHHFLDDPLVQSHLLDLIPAFKLSKRMIIILTPVMKLPQELEKEFALVEMEFPTKEELKPVLHGIVKNLPKELAPSEEKTELVIEAARGLTTSEAENAFSLSIVRPRMINPDSKEWDEKIVLAEKCAALKKTGLLEYIPVDLAGLSAVGGLENLKEFVRKRRRAFSPEAREFGLPPPKGIAAFGPPGTGKSFCAKAISSELHMPLVRLEMGNVYGGLVGQSEANIRMAIRTAEAVAPCVLWIDEIEKGMATGSGSTDSGVGKRVLNSILTWMQEKTAPVFVYATANKPWTLPSELLRKGRFDEQFFLDLPNPEERKEIFRLHLTKKNRAKLIGDRSKGKIDLEHFAGEISDQFTGAEIEAAIIEALYTAFEAGREMSHLDLQLAFDDTQPLAKMMAEDIRQTREWCKDRARAANTNLGDAPHTLRSGRTLEA